MGTSTGIDAGAADRGDAEDLAQQCAPAEPYLGGQVLLGQVASITPAQGPSQIQRRDRQRVITLGASLVQGAVLGDVSQQVDRTMKETAAQWPAGYRFTLGGEWSRRPRPSSSSERLLLSIVLVYMLLVGPLRVAALTP